MSLDFPNGGKAPLVMNNKNLDRAHSKVEELEKRIEKLEKLLAKRIK